MVGIRYDTKRQEEKEKGVPRAWRDKADWPYPSPHGIPSSRNQGQSDVLHADHVRQHSRHTQSPGSLHPNDTGRSSRQTSGSSIRPGLTVPQEGGDRPILTRVRHGTILVLNEREVI